MTSAAAPRPECVEAGAGAIFDHTAHAMAAAEREAALVVVAVAPLIRADERQAQIEGPWGEERRHAEAVAARLVKVICEQERALADMTSSWREAVRLTRSQIAADVESLHSDYDPSGSGDRRHACMDEREHDLLERCEAIARGES